MFVVISVFFRFQGSSPQTFHRRTRFDGTKNSNLRLSCQSAPSDEPTARVEILVMTLAEMIVIVLVIGVLLLIIGNIVFARISERRNPPLGKFIECDGVRLHYIERGDAAAPWIVLFHGNGSMIQDFLISGLVDLLAERNRVLCFDRPGFGHSERPRLRIWTASAQASLFINALKSLGVRDPIVLGHSWGTLVALGISLRDDYPVKGLVLASGYYFPTTRFDVWLMSGPAVPVLGDLAAYTIAPIISWLMLPLIFRKLFAPRSVSATFKRNFPKSLMLRPKQLRAAAEESAMMVPTAVQMQLSYPSIRCPVRIFHGTGDQISDVGQARRLNDALALSELRLVQDAGHMVHYVATSNIALSVSQGAALLKQGTMELHA
jgi:pimeloyl-ACP methyl ester carboxylesterase